MSERFYTAENVLDLVRRVFNVTVLSNKDKTEWISNVVFPRPDGWMTMANGGKGKDYYDGLYTLLYQIAKFKQEGKMPDNVMALREGESHPVEVLIDLKNERKLMEADK